MSLNSLVRILICIPFFTFVLSSCNKNDAEVRSAVKVLSLVGELCRKDSLPANDSILNFPVKVFSREEMDSCLAMAYFYQGEIQRKNFYLLRAIDSYLLAKDYAGGDSMLHFRINLELAKIYRFKMRHDMEASYINSAERLLKTIGDTSAYVEYLHEKALYYRNMNDMENVYSAFREALSYTEDGSRIRYDIYKHLSEAYLVSGIADSVVYFADKALEDCHSIKLKSELLLTKGLAYAAIDRPDSLSHYFSPNIYNVKLSLRVKAFRAVSDMYDRMGNGREAHAFLKKYTLALDTLISDRKEEFMEKIHGIHEYKIQKDRANKAEMQAASNQLMFSNFVLAALLVILFLSVLLHYYRANRRKLTERLREETCLKMEEKIKRRDMEISLANKQEELRQKEIEKLNKNIDYYKQLNNVTLPIIMRRQNAQGALHLSDEDWNIIVGNADACFDMFSERLKKLCPQLTEDDIRFCCLVKMELSMSVLSEIYHIAKASISRRKMRLKEKIGIENVSFDEFIIGF